MPPPSGSLVLLDASQASTLTLGGVQASDGGSWDTWNTVATQPTSALQPFYDAGAFGNGPCSMFGGLGFPVTTQYAQIASLAYGLPMTLVLAFRADGARTVCELSSDVTSNPGVLVTSSSGWSFRVRGSGGNEQRIDVASGAYWATQNEFHWIAFSHDGTTPTFFLDGQPAALSVNQPGGPPGVGAITQPVTIGAGHGGANPLVGAISFFGVWPRVFSAADLAQMGSYLTGLWRFTPSQFQAYSLQSFGDSITGGATCFTVSPNIWGFGSLLRQYFGNKFGVPLVGENSGQPIATIQANWDSIGKPDLDTTRKNVLLFQGGGNDFVQWPGGINNSTQAAAAAAATTNAMHTWVTDAVNAANPLSTGGPHVIAIHTDTFIGAATSFLNQARQTYNGNLVAQAPGWGAANVLVTVVQTGQDNILGTGAGWPPPDGANTNYVTPAGAIHPCRSGHQRWSGMTARALLGLGL